MNVLLWIIFGGLAGWIASIITGTEAAQGIFGNIAVGIVGAFIGGWIADHMGVSGAPGAERPTTLTSFMIAVLGAIVVLFLVNLIF